MADVYSALIFQGHAITTTDFALDPARLYVIRQFTAFFPGTDVLPAAQLIDLASNVTLWWVHQAYTTAGYYQQDNDLRIVLPVGATLRVTGTGSPDISISGYALTLP